MAIAMPLTQSSVESILNWIIGRCTWAMESFARAIMGPESERPFVPKEIRVSGMRVELETVRERALRDKDSFWLTCVKECETEEKAAERNATALAALSFATVVLAAVDSLFLPGTSTLYALAGHISAATGLSITLGWAAIAVAGATVSVPWITELLREQYPTVWIKHPRLAEELMTEFRRRQDDLRKLMARQSEAYVDP